MYTALTIAGSDSGGGAGIQADIKTMTALGIYASSALTALTAQNTTGVSDCFEVSPEFLGSQLDCIFSDIFPDAVKIGMTSNAALVEVIADRLTHYHAGNIVTDPVMLSTSGSRLIQESAVKALSKLIFPLSTLITPNIPEAEVLSGHPITSPAQMEETARRLSCEYGCAVLIKGGHQVNTANDVLCEAGSLRWFCSTRINNPNTHGTGCTMSSAIAAHLAVGMTLSDAIAAAKDYLTGAIAAMLDLGKGSGPLNHMYRIQSGQGE